MRRLIVILKPKSYTNTYFNTALSSKTNVSTLDSYYTKTDIDTNFYDRTYTDALPNTQIKYNNGFVDLDKIDFKNNSITTQTDPTIYEITSTPNIRIYVIFRVLQLRVLMYLLESR